jgi:hypothetical protein
MATLAVVPKHTVRRAPSELNVLFFAHFEYFTREEYLARMSAICDDDSEVYREITADLYALGVYLERRKHRFLRLAYGTFLIGTVAALSVQLWHELMS